MSGKAPPLLLVAEDNAANQQVAVAMLSKLGLSAEIAADGAEAVIAYRSGRFAAIFMDCQMPVLDGYAATGEIRALEPQGERIPIIAMTASVTGDVRLRCVAAGMDDYLSKPVMFDKLRAILDRWVLAPLQTAAGAVSTTSAAPSMSHTAPFTAERVAELRTLNTPTTPDMFGQLATQFLDDATRRLTLLREALYAGDRVRAIAEAHTIYGGAATLGAAPLAAAAKGLEADLADGLDADSDQLVSFEIQRATAYLSSGGEVGNGA